MDQLNLLSWQPSDSRSLHQRHPSSQLLFLASLRMDPTISFLPSLTVALSPIATPKGRVMIEHCRRERSGLQVGQADFLDHGVE